MMSTEDIIYQMMLTPGIAYSPEELKTQEWCDGIAGEKRAVKDLEFDEIFMEFSDQIFYNNPTKKFFWDDKRNALVIPNFKCITAPSLIYQLKKKVKVDNEGFYVKTDEGAKYMLYFED